MCVSQIQRFYGNGFQKFKTGAEDVEGLIYITHQMLMKRYSTKNVVVKEK